MKIKTRYSHSSKMIKTTEIDGCPNCYAMMNIYRTRNGKRFAKCENPDCDFSYSIPAAGKIVKMDEKCPKTGIPVLLITNSKNSKRIRKSYFWTNSPCFTCANACDKISNLVEIFSESGDYGF